MDTGSLVRLQADLSLMVQNQALQEQLASALIEQVASVNAAVMSADMATISPEAMAMLAAEMQAANVGGNG